MLRTLLKRELKLGTACSAKTFYSSVQVLFSDVSILWCSKRPKKNFDMFIPQTEVKPGMRQEVNTFWNFETIHMQSVIPWYCYRLENYKLHTGRQLDAGIVWGGGGPPAGLLQYLWIFANFLWSLTSSSICEFQEYCVWLRILVPGVLPRHQLPWPVLGSLQYQKVRLKKTRRYKKEKKHQEVSLKN